MQTLCQVTTFFALTSKIILDHPEVTDAQSDTTGLILVALTIVPIVLAFLLEGTVMVEVIFGRPGLGTFLLNAIEARDFPHVQAVVILTALLFVGVNLAIDVIYQIVDPRMGERDA